MLNLPIEALPPKDIVKQQWTNESAGEFWARVILKEYRLVIHKDDDLIRVFWPAPFKWTYNSALWRLLLYVSLLDFFRPPTRMLKVTTTFKT